MRLFRNMGVDDADSSRRLRKHVDQPFLGKPQQRLPDRRLADPELGRQLDPRQRRPGRQRRHRIEPTPDQTGNHQQQHNVADVGMDRAMEEAVRPRRDVIHPPAVGQHADDGEAEAPVKQAGDAAPATVGIADHALVKGSFSLPSHDFTATTRRRTGMPPAQTGMAQVAGSYVGAPSHDCRNDNALVTGIGVLFSRA